MRDPRKPTIDWAALALGASGAKGSDKDGWMGPFEKYVVFPVFVASWLIPLGIAVVVLGMLLIHAVASVL